MGFTFNFGADSAPAISNHELNPPQAQSLFSGAKLEVQEGACIAAQQISFPSPEPFLVVVEAVNIPNRCHEGEDSECKISLWKREDADISIALAKLDSMESEVTPEGILIQALQSSDLVPSLYEGGLKTWECALDMVHFLSGLPDVEFVGKRAIELGCGSALPGCYALQRGALVDFQDYNDLVLRLVTMPNVLLNTTHKCEDSQTEPVFETELCYPSENPDNSPAFFFGDWGSLTKVAGETRYDLIVTTETIYSAESLIKLYETIKSLIKVGGKAFVGAKRNYFGCSGSLLQFEQYAQKEGSCTVQTVYTAPAAVRRDIAMLQF